MAVLTAVEIPPRMFLVKTGYTLNVPPKWYQPGAHILVTSAEQLRAIEGQWWKVAELPFRPSRRKMALSELEPGDKLLLERRLGGLGDVLVQTQLFPMLKDQFPDIQVDYAVPSHYQSLFEGSGVIADRPWWSKETGLGAHYATNTSAGNSQRTEIWKEYDLIEDITQCCAQYEMLLQWYGTFDGNVGLKIKDRLEIWAHHIGLQVEHPRTCIVLRPEEIAEAKSRFGAPKKPVLLLAPLSGSDARCYPWHADLLPEVEKRWQVFYLHPLPIGPNTLTNLTLRQMGATIAAADAIISVDSAAFHWAGILRKPVIGLFNFLHGKEARAKFYPTAKCLQACDTPCLGYKYPRGTCTKKTTEALPIGPAGRGYSTCFHRDSVRQVLKLLKGLK